jgi:hypothetical protein
MKDYKEYKGLEEKFVTHGNRARVVAEKFATFVIEITAFLLIHENAYREAGLTKQADTAKSLSAIGQSLMEEVREVFVDARDDIGEIFDGYCEILENLENME